MTVEKLMHEGVEWVGPETPVSELAKLMSEKDIGSVPVVENDRLIGMVTDRDIATRAFANGADTSNVTAADVMTKDVIYCYAKDSTKNAIKKMEEKRIRRLVIVDEGTRMVGVLSIGDLSSRLGAKHMVDLIEAVSQHHSQLEVSRAPTVIASA